MKFGAFEITPVIFDNFRLDGGAMFGSVPKNLWSRKIAPDAENCIPLVTRSLLIRHKERLFLIDAGIGSKGDAKFNSIFGITSRSWEDLPFKPQDVTDVIITHLHFDHAGGVSYYNEKRELCPQYPGARFFLQRKNIENADAPTLRERASYLAENVEVVKQSKLTLLEGSEEIYPDIWVHPADGHTRGLQWIEIIAGDERLVYPSDLMPTSHHVGPAYIMGYDICAETSLREKLDFLQRAADGNWLVVFEHDAEVCAGRITRDAGGGYALGEGVAL